MTHDTSHSTTDESVLDLTSYDATRQGDGDLDVSYCTLGI